MKNRNSPSSVKPAVTASATTSVGASTPAAAKPVVQSAQPINPNKYSPTPLAKAAMGDLSGPKMPSSKPVVTPLKPTISSAEIKDQRAQNQAATDTGRTTLGKGPDVAMRDKLQNKSTPSVMTSIKDRVASNGARGAGGSTNRSVGALTPSDARFQRDQNQAATDTGRTVLGKGTDATMRDRIQGKAVTSVMTDVRDRVAAKNNTPVVKPAVKPQASLNKAPVNEPINAPKLGFKDAFKAARKGGLSTFKWNGKEYHTGYKGETKTQTKSANLLARRKAMNSPAGVR